MKSNITQEIFDASYCDLTERAKIDFDFLLLTLAAATICAFGFKMNSAPVIIGAMVVSPLLYSIVCAGVATYRTDWSAFIRAVGTFATGFLVTISAAVVIGLFFATTFRSEIVDRLSTAGVDYAVVAFISGLAGTYAFYSPKIHEAIAGIAISVALIPPIVMLGFGLSFGIAAQNINLALVSCTILLSNAIGIYLGSIVMVAVLHRIVRVRTMPQG